MVRNVRATRVYQTVRANLQTPLRLTLETYKGNRTAHQIKVVPVIPPPWFKAIESVPPSEIFTRPVARRPGKKAKQLYQPPKLVYPEDKLRREFYEDHPWELARPRMILELDGKDSRYIDWSKGLRQPGMPLCGECVVQRQLWFMQHGMPKDEAYDTARKEFYRLRQEEDVGRRIALEEARMVGAYFGKTNLQVGMELEDMAFGNWKGWAQEELLKQEVARSEATSAGDPALKAVVEPEAEEIMA